MQTNGDDLTDLRLKLSSKESTLDNAFLKCFNLVEHFTDKMKVPMGVLVILLFIVQVIFIISMAVLGGYKFHILGTFTYSFSMNNLFLALSVEGLVTMFLFLYAYTSLLHIQVLGYKNRISELNSFKK